MARGAIMVDVDGVLIRHPDRAGWIAHLERDLGIAPAALQAAFFRPHWDDVVHGRATLRERLAPVLAADFPNVACDTLVDYWFSNDAHVDQALLSQLQALRQRGFEVHLATVQEHERAAYLWDRLEFRARFDGMHYAAALGCSKPAAAFYRAIETAIGIAGGDIFFIDDKPENVEAAQACGWVAAVWTGEDAVEDLMTRHTWPSR